MDETNIAPNDSDAGINCEPVYELVDADLERDRETVIGIWRGHIGWRGQLEEMYDAFYLNCPLGRPLLKILNHRPTNIAVGVIALGHRRMLWQGREIRACVVSHFVVLPEHRTLKPAVAMVKAVIEMAAERFDLLYGLPSAKASAAGRRAGLKITGQLTRYVKILRYQHYLERIMPKPLAFIGGFTLNFITRMSSRMRGFSGRSQAFCELVDTADPRMQKLWERSTRGDGLTAIREMPMIKWRFCDLPARERKFFLVSPAQGQPLSAWFACETNVLTPTVLTITDFWTTAGPLGIDRRMIRALCDSAYLRGFHTVEVRFFGDARVLSGWLDEGFIERNGQPLHSVWLNKTMAGDIAPNAYLTDIDLDS